MGYRQRSEPTDDWQHLDLLSVWAVHRGGAEPQAPAKRERVRTVPLAGWCRRDRRFTAAYLRGAALTHASSVVSDRSPVRAAAEQRKPHERREQFSTCSGVCETIVTRADTVP